MLYMPSIFAFDFGSAADKWRAYLFRRLLEVWAMEKQSVFPLM